MCSLLRRSFVPGAMTDDNEVVIAARSRGCGICLPFVPQLFSDHRRVSGSGNNQMLLIRVVVIKNVTGSHWSDVCMYICIDISMFNRKSCIHIGDVLCAPVY